MQILFNILYGIYNLIAYLIPLFLFFIAFIKTEQRSRYIFLSFIVIFYILPLIFPLPFKNIVLFIIRIILGIGCYLYLIAKGISLRWKAPQDSFSEEKGKGKAYLTHLAKLFYVIQNDETARSIIKIGYSFESCPRSQSFRGEFSDFLLSNFSRSQAILIKFSDILVTKREVYIERLTGSQEVGGSNPRIYYYFI